MKKEYNNDQLQAIETSSKSSIVVAGAGTGKTKTIIGRIDYLIKSGVMPDKILVLTFTKKAAVEISGRIRHNLKSNGISSVTATTFHGWCSILIRSFMKEAPTIIDREDQEYLMASARGKKPKDFIKKDELTRIYSYCRNTDFGIADYINKYFPNLISVINDLREVFVKYEDLKKQRRYIDYDDMLDISARLMTIEKFSTEVSSRYKYIFIDEMQDTNALQWKIISPLLERVHLFCVGDDAQSIYAFRGSDYRMVNQFQSMVPGAFRFNLNINYRSTNEILKLSNWLLSKSVIKYEKHLFSERSGLCPEIHIFNTIHDEARFIVDEISKNKISGGNYSDELILIRSAYSGRGIEAALLRDNIPYVNVGGSKLLQSAHIKDFLSALRIVYNIKDTISWMRYLMIFPGIGEGGASDFVDNLINAESTDDFLKSSKNEKFIAPLSIIEGLDDGDLTSIIKSCIIKMSDYLELKWRKEWSARSKDLPLILKMIKNDMSLQDFLENYVFNELMETKGDGDFIDHVTISTVHGAKGTESKNCYLYDVNPGNYPSSHAKNDDEIEEERRVLYVALTRAKERLVLTRSMGNFSKFKGSETRYFFDDVPAELVNTVLHDNDQSSFKTDLTLSDDMIFTGGIKL